MSSHWCYRCNKFVRVWRQDITICPECDSGFVEEVNNHNSTATLFLDNRRRRFPAAAMYMIGGNHHHHHHHHHNLPNFNENDDENSPREGNRRPQQHCPMMTNSIAGGGDRSPFNPVIMLRGNGSSGEGSSEGSSRRRGFDLFYDDGANVGLRPLPPSMSEFLLGTGFDRVLEQLSQIERHDIENNHHQHHRQNPPPASKSTVETLPMVEIGENHLATEPHCAVCKEPFELGTRVKEMPCKHIYHSECILPWLAMRNSCPVCRHELPPDEDHVQSMNARASAEENVGLTIWRLPGGGYAVGRFSGGRTERDQILQVPSVYTEMDGGGFGNNSNNDDVGEEGTRRVSWTVESSRERRTSVGGGLRRLVNNLFGCFTSGGGRGGGIFRHRRSNSSSTRESIRPLRGASVVRSSLNSDYSSSARSRNRTWSMDVQNGMRHW